MEATGIVISIAAQVLEKISPEIRKVIQGLIADLRVKAEATSNPWDDILVELLAGIFS
ncbi:MAG TPA: hypothetical protein VMW42_10745 [Desulfatiglandales bacterium]|nr:hypothetical protein [Desulfatiglandales bacterium]